MQPIKGKKTCKVTTDLILKYCGKNYNFNTHVLIKYRNPGKKNYRELLKTKFSSMACPPVNRNVLVLDVLIGMCWCLTY